MKAASKRLGADLRFKSDIELSISRIATLRLWTTTLGKVLLRCYHYVQDDFRSKSVDHVSNDCATDNAYQLLLRTSGANIDWLPRVQRLTRCDEIVDIDAAAHFTIALRRRFP